MSLFSTTTLSEVRYPDGITTTSETIHWDAVYGGFMCGTGGILEDSTHQPCHGTRLVHGHDKTQPTLLYQGFGGSIDRVTFCGDERLKSTPKEERTAAGIIVDKREDPPSGFGTGKLYLRDVSFCQYKRAIQLGLIVPGQDHTKEHNADQILIGRIHTQGCDTMLRVEHEQGLDVNILHARPYITEQVFDFEGGGDLNCEFLMCMYGVKQILRTGQRVGSNSGSFVINGTIVDSNNAVPVFFRQGLRCASMEVTFRNVRIGNGCTWPSEPIFLLLGGSTLTLDGFKHLKPGMIKFTNSIVEKYKNHVHLNSVISAVSDVAELFSPESKGTCYVTVGALRGGFGQVAIPAGSYIVTANGGQVTSQRIESEPQATFTAEVDFPSPLTAVIRRP